MKKTYKDYKYNKFKKMSKKTVSDVIFQNLAGKGIDTCFMVTGGGAMFLNDALQKINRLKKYFVIMNRHVQSQDSYFRFTNKPAIVQVTTALVL